MTDFTAHAADRRISDAIGQVQNVAREGHVTLPRARGRSRPKFVAVAPGHCPVSNGGTRRAPRSLRPNTYDLIGATATLINGALGVSMSLTGSVLFANRQRALPLSRSGRRLPSTADRGQGVSFVNDRLNYSKHVGNRQNDASELVLSIGHDKRATRGCPCGFAGDSDRECRCTPQQVNQYRSRMSGPLRDRLDLTVEVPAVPPDVLGAGASGECSEAVRARVVAARERQRERLGSLGAPTNSSLTPPLMARYCRLNSPGLRLLANAVKRLGLTARGYDRVRKVARTIADLAGADHIDADHIAEALQFRMVN